MRRAARNTPVGSPPIQPVGSLLVAWYHAGHRDLPWRNSRDPYRVWVSEIMLQQTRAQAVIPYYERFLERFPTVAALAAAREDDVLALWSGLGYYSRARNLRRAAQQIVAGGCFPRDYDAIRALPGVGDYTAAAVASIAFSLPYAVLDGNVLRVVARVENDAADISSARTRQRFRAIAQRWLDAGADGGERAGDPDRLNPDRFDPDRFDPDRFNPDRFNPGHFNQALMELGATVCLPRKPLCLVCPLASGCRARQEGTAAQLPVKLRKTEPVRIVGVLLVVRQHDRVLLRRRPDAGTRMAGFWDLPTPEELPRAKVGERLGEIRHTITHHRYTFEVRSATASLPRTGGFGWFTFAQLVEIPFSTTARKALRLAGFVYNL